MDFENIQQQFDAGDNIKGLAEARLALEKLNFILETEDLTDAQRASIERFADVLSDNVNALNKNQKFFDDAAQVIASIIAEDEPRAINFSAINPESEHAYKPILKDESNVATIARNLDSFLYVHSGERPVTLSQKIWEFMDKKGIEDCSAVWKPIGLGRRSWHNLITRYEKEEKYAPKLVLLQVAIGLRLDFDETNELLENQCYRLTKSKRDLIFVYYIANRKPFEKESNHYDAALEEATKVRQKLAAYGFTPFSEVFD